MKTSAEKASFARPYWNAATLQGAPHETTTFHTQYNKHDYRYSYGRVGEFVRQDGLRGLALGYLSKVRFIRFVSTPLATELTGIDLTKPGQSGEQAARLNVIAREFFALLVQYSLSHPFRDGDYGNVSRSRGLPHGSFCIFTGFQEALSSKELRALRKVWKQRYKEQPPQPPQPPPTPESRSRSPSPVPPTPVDDEDDRLEDRVVEAFRAARAHRADGEFGASGFHVPFDEPLFWVQCNLRRRRRNSGDVRVTLVPKGALRKRLRTRALHAVDEIRAAFARSRRSNN
tara:strand:+ start:205 stop:1065 length:861 start_codon:yes stop_codon:yes gene_type:complete